MADSQAVSTPPKRRKDSPGRLLKASAEGDLATTIAMATRRRARAVNERMQTPLMLAAIGGWDQCVLALIPHSDPRQADECGRTALLLAARAGQTGCVAALLPVSDPHTEDHDARNALMFAAVGGHGACVELLTPETMLSARDCNLDTALELAAQSGSVECLRLLLAAVPRLDLQTARHAAHATIQAGALDCLQEMIGPLTAACQATSVTPEDRPLFVWRELCESASYVGHVDALRVVLLRYDMALREVYGEELIHESGSDGPFGLAEAAARGGSSECVRMLLSQVGYETLIRGALTPAAVARMGDKCSALILRELAMRENEAISSVVGTPRRRLGRACRI